MVVFPQFGNASYRVEGDHLVPKSAWESFAQNILPCLSTQEDRKVAKFFQEHLDRILNRTGTLSAGERKNLYESVQSFITRWKVTDRPPQEVKKLERCLLVATERFPALGKPADVDTAALRERIKVHDRKEFQKWVEKYHLPEDIYYTHPDFVQFIFESHLHRNLEVYGHKILSVAGEPWIMVNGAYRPWRTIQANLEIHHGKIYHVEEGVKKRWTYLEQGFVEYDPSNWTEPRPFKTLKEKPGQYQFQIVTSHVEESQYQFYDSVLKGARHTWFRLITPDGKVYSFGGRIKASDFNLLQPMAGVKGFVECPDVYEFCPEHQLVTTIPITEEAARNVFEVAKHRQQAEVFNFVETNCCSFTRGMLNAAGLDDIPCESHASDSLYKLIVPRFIRWPIKMIWRCTFGLILPKKAAELIVSFKNVLFTAALSPLFTLLGAWRGAPVRYQEENGEVLGYLQRMIDRHDLNAIVKSQTQGSLFRSVWDIFDPKRMTVSMTTHLAKWQRQQGDRTKYY
jgi:hypothetical protein